MTTPTLSTIVVNVGPSPQQIPVGATGATIINTLSESLTISTDLSMQVNTIVLQPGASTTFDSGTTYYCTTPTAAQISVIAGKQNYSSGTTVISGGTVTIIPGPDPIDVTGQVDVTGSNININAGNVVEVVNEGSNNLNVGPQLELLNSGVTGVNGGTGWVQSGITLPPNINTIFLVLGGIALAGGQLGYVFGNNTKVVQVVPFNLSIPPGTLYPLNGAISFPCPVFSAGGADTSFSVNWPGVPAGTPYFIFGSNDYYASIVDVEGNVSITGLVTLSGVNNAINNWRTDARAYPLGSNISTTTMSAASGNCIVSPGAGKHILLSSLKVDPPGELSANNVITVKGTIATNNSALISLFLVGGVTPAVFFPPQPIPFYIPPQGLLLDANTALTYTNSAASTGLFGTPTCVAVYDVVS